MKLLILIDLSSNSNKLAVYILKLPLFINLKNHINMTLKKERVKQAKIYRKIFGLSFIDAHKIAKRTLRLSDVPHLPQSQPVIEDCYCGRRHCMVKVTALDHKVYTFIDGVLW